jgi:hypothetical protein
MKSLLLIMSMTVIFAAWAGDKPVNKTESITGTVMEIKDVDSYTYLRIKTVTGDKWAAVNKSPVRKGSKVTIENVTIMNDFESRSLNQTFKTIAFGNLAGAATPKSGHASMAHPATAQPANTPDVRVAKASGANAWTVAEINAKAQDLKDKPVVVRGKIVKYNPAIMGKNWLHLRDGSGNAADSSNDILVTTAAEAKLGDIVTVKGVVRTEKDFGSGYAYKALIEEASIQK